MKVISRFVVALFLIMAARLCYSVSNKNIEVMKHLNRLNKPPVASIKSHDGDIIDCVHILHQPAFDHRLLKDHTIQMNPSYYPDEVNDHNMNIKASSMMIPSKHESLSSIKHKRVPQLWHLNGECPKQTVPIRRTKKEDVLRASSFKTYGKKSSFTTFARLSFIDPNDNTHEHAIAYTHGEFYGAKATMNVWNPNIQQINEFSLSQIWILGGTTNSDLNTIEAGWQVNPELYGDNNTRLFIYWTSDGYQTTGCHNLLCSGFIQTNNEIAIGASISPISQFQGAQYDITILIWKDPRGGDWWMQFQNGQVLGYWPAKLFTYLTHNASTIEWGGEVVNVATDGQHTTTQMGSGQFPEEGFSKASFFRDIKIVDESNGLRTPKDIETFTTKPNCYNAEMVNSDNWGTHFYYGGPGRNSNCP